LWNVYIFIKKEAQESKGQPLEHCRKYAIETAQRVAEADNLFERQREKFSAIKGNDVTEELITFKYNERVLFALFRQTVSIQYGHFYANDIKS